MKRKISQFLMLALMVVSVGFLGSCKDYDEDNYADLLSKLQDQDASLTELLNAQVANLQSQIDALKAAQTQCKSDCKTRMDELEALIKGIEKCDCAADRAELRQKIEENANAIADLKAADEALQGAIDKINSTLETVQNDIQKNKDDIAKLISDLSDVNTTATNAAALAQEAKDLAEANGVKIDDLTGVVNSLKETVAAQGEDIQKALADAANAQATADANSAYIQQMMVLLPQYVAELQAKDQALANSVDSVANELTDLKGYVDSLAVVSAKNFQTAIAIAKQGDEEVKAALEEEINNLKNDVEVKLSDLETAYKAADEKLQQQIDTLNTEVTTNTANIAANTQAISDLTGRVNALEQAVKEVQDALAKQVSGIIVQGTENPAFGTFALPVDVRSNVLIAYIGKAVDDITFPTISTGNYVWTSQALTEDEAAIIGAGMDTYTKKSNKTLISNAADNAGHIYVTVNPNTVDFTGAQLYLENSQAKSAGITLSPLRKSDETLTFGYTRAASNGFYEADANITAEDVDNGKVQLLNLDKSGFKDIAKDLVHNRNSFDITEAAETVYEQFNDVLDANAVKASWTDSYGEHSVYSQYNVAATAVKPLSYNFLSDYYGRQTITGYEKVQNFINRVAKKVKDEVKSQWPDLDLDNISIESINSKDFTVEFAIRIATDGVNSRAYVEKIGDLTYIVVENKTYDLGGNEIWQQTVKIALNDEDATALAKGTAYTQDGHNCNTVWDLDIKKGIDGADDIYAEINGSLDDINDFLDDVNDMLDDVNSTETTIINETDKLADKVKEYLDKINNKGIDYLNNAIMRLQPCTLVKTAKDGIRLGYNMPNLPMVVNGNEVTLIITSYNDDILTPAFKKHVACVNVINGDASAQKGDATLKAEAARVNGLTNLNTVLDGSSNNVTVSGLKSGYTYQFAYSAVDYCGKMATTRCTICVK